MRIRFWCGPGLGVRAGGTVPMSFSTVVFHWVKTVNNGTTIWWCLKIKGSTSFTSMFTSSLSLWLWSILKHSSLNSKLLKFLHPLTLLDLLFVTYFMYKWSLHRSGKFTQTFLKLPWNTSSSVMDVTTRMATNTKRHVSTYKIWQIKSTFGSCLISWLKSSSIIFLGQSKNTWHRRMFTVYSPFSIVCFMTLVLLWCL